MEYKGLHSAALPPRRRRRRRAKCRARYFVYAHPNAPAFSVTLVIFTLFFFLLLLLFFFVGGVNLRIFSKVSLVSMTN